jgi:hypothetical protein
MPQDSHAKPAAAQARTYLGTCECGLIRYNIELVLGTPDARTRSVWEHSAPPSGFRLLAGHEHLIGYQFAREDVHHFFCIACQARAFSLCAPEQAAYYCVDLKALRGLAANAAPSALAVATTPQPSRCTRSP